jgi:glycosyltransferase involved in cell wall biosynthesis
MFKRSISDFTIKLLFSLSLLFILNTGEAFGKSEKPMAIVVPSYNNIQWYQKNLDSILSQQYENYRVIYVNDNSKDGLDKAVEQYLSDNGVDYKVISFDDSFSDDIFAIVDKFAEQVNEEPHFFILVNNVNRIGAMANLYRMIYSCKDPEIIVTVDGDDWLFHEDVLKDLNDAYSAADIWFTHGTLKEYPWGHVAWCEPIPPEYIYRNAFREFKCPSHLRTFYTWIFKKIKLEDFLHHGKFFPMAWDMAIMLPIAEMAGERHAFMEKVNYVYNMANQINDNKVNAQLQNDLDRHIRNMPRYQRLEKTCIPLHRY